MQREPSSLRVLTRLGSKDSQAMADEQVPESPVRTPRTIMRAAAALRVEDVYKSLDDDSDNFELTKEDSFRQPGVFTKQDSSRSAKNATFSKQDSNRGARTQNFMNKEDSHRSAKNDPTRRTEEEDDLHSYEEFRFDLKGDSEEKEEEPLPKKSSTTSSTKDDPIHDDERVRELLLAFLQVHEPRAVTDGRLEGLVAWARERGVPKLRMALKEKYRADLMFPQKSGRLGVVSEVEETSEKRLLRSKAWGSFLKFRPRKDSS